MLVNVWSNFSDQIVRPLATCTSCTVARTWSPDRWIVPLKIASTCKARPAASGSSTGPLYFDTALVGKTTSCFRLLILPITASAMPNPNNSSSISWPSGSNGNTAIEWTRSATVPGEVAGVALPILCFLSQPTLGPRARNAAASTITPRTASANRPPILPGDCCRPFAVTSSVPLSANVGSVRCSAFTVVLPLPV